MNDTIFKRTQIGDLNDGLVQTDKTFDVEVLRDSVLAVCAVVCSRVDKGADRSDIVGGLEPAAAVSLGNGGVRIFRGQEEDDDVETGLKSVFLYIDPNSPTKIINRSPYMTIIQRISPIVKTSILSVNRDYTRRENQRAISVQVSSAKLTLHIFIGRGSLRRFFMNG